MKKLLVTAIFLSIIQAFSFAQEEKETPDFKDQRELTVIVPVQPYNLDPHTATYVSEAQILTGLTEGLFSYNPVSAAPVPAICQSYKVSRNKKKWTFTLHEDACFSDGSKITAETFRQSWLRLLKTENAPFSSFLDCVEGAADYRMGKVSENEVGIKARDEKTLVLNLTEPTAHLPALLCHFSLSAVSKDKDVYSGPFVLESYKDNQLVLKKNMKYREASSVALPSIKYIQCEDSDANAFSYNNGEADWVDSVAASDKIINTDAIHANTIFGSSYLFFKPVNEPWDKPDFRNALIEAIPYDKLRDKYPVKATTLVYPLPNYPSVNGISGTDADDAVELMEEARKKAGIPKNKKLPLVFAISDNDYYKNITEILKEAWEPLGVKVITQTTPEYRYNYSIKDWNADLFSYAWVGDYADPLAFLELFKSGSSFNVGNYSNPEFDKYLTLASTADSTQERYTNLAKAEQLLLDDGEIIPISHSISYHVINTEKIGGWSTNALDIHPLKYLYIKEENFELPEGMIIIKYPED
ncbi:peptide ABC transporter substrate-binding protein [Treponema sp.]|uniref:peptide ABC transporter substrate-binding protein n=1 Tax=Treponema sp. TaxID=166 RepID=UPI0025E82B2A|nr:peptide ABC transporter substrate-binding protein [Treponema sp.]MCR5219086.1 peptide ABC transporter substrate-binding protein [Treponema sp.]